MLRETAKLHEILKIASYWVENLTRGLQLSKQYS
jgi:hypothetical protein